MPFMIVKLMMKSILSILVCLVLLTGAGCGVYTFNPGGKSSIKTIAVTQFENNTIEVGLSSRLTDLVVDALIADGSMKVVSADNADAILHATLTDYKREAHDYDESDNVTQYIVKINFDVRLEKGNEVDEDFWSEQFYSYGIFSPDSEIEEDGQTNAAEKLVTDIINRTTKSW